MALSLLKKISLPLLSFSAQLSLFIAQRGKTISKHTVLGMIYWAHISLLRAGYRDMVVFECVTVANEGCRCLEGCYGEMMRDCAFQQGYGRLCV